MSVRHMLQFFLLLPLCLGLFFGAARIGAYEFVTIGHHMVYFSLFNILAWACYGLGSALSAVILRPWKPHLLVVLTAGFFVGGFCLWWPLRDLLNAGFEPFLAPGSRFGRFWPPPPDNLAWYVAISIQSVAIWVLANWLDFRYRRVPRFGFAAPPAPVRDQPARTEQRGGESVEPRLCERLPEGLKGAEIVALEAEEHYTKVYTDRGNALLLLRFSDAIREMEPKPGLQVHRSYWVSTSNVRAVSQAGKRMVLNLDTGLVVPVSRSYRVMVRSAGFASEATPEH